MSGLFVLIPTLVLFAEAPTPDVPDTEKAPIPFLTPEQSLKALQLPEGFQATMFAHEPMVRQPIALATDERGRLWVAENYTYSERTPGWNDALRDRVIILEDTDRDGKADKRRVFWDRGRRLTSVEIGYGGVWVLDAPNLLFIPDKNRDDVPDGEPVVMLDGWDDGAVRHNIVNGLRWGPDGWLYGRHGILATSRVGRPGASPDQRTPINCGIWRFHPTRHTFEVVCHGTTNPWGMDWDENGQLFFINTVIGHLWHVIPGAHYRRMYGEDFNPHLYQLIEQTADHFHWDTAEQWSDIRKLGVTATTDKAGGGHAHSGMVIIKSKNWPKEYQGSMLTVNLHGARINRDTLHREGATYVGKHAPDFAKTSDPYFRGVELIEGADGDLFIADWSDVGECHENDGVHRSSGRILRITPHQRRQFVPGQRQYQRLGNLQGAASADADLGILGRMDLAELVQSGDAFQRRIALRLLGERGSKSDEWRHVHEMFRTRVLHEQTVASSKLPRFIAVQSLYALYVSSGCTEEFLVGLLKHADEQIRATAIRLLCDHDVPSDAALASMSQLAKTEKSGLVQTALASVLQRLTFEKRWPLAADLVEYAKSADDRVFPLMVWYGIEPAVPVQPAEAVKLAQAAQIPLVREFIVRRLTSNIERQPEPVSDLVKALSKQSDEKQQLDMLRGMVAALRGWRKAPLPAEWKRTAEQLAVSRNTEIQQLTRELSLVFGDGRALDELRQIVAKENGKPDERRSALRALVIARAEGLVPLLQSLIGHRELGIDAIRGLAAFESPDSANLLISRYGGVQTQAKQEIISTLVSRPSYARPLLAAVATGKLPKADVSPFQLRQIQSFGDDDLNRQVATLWPELQKLSQEKASRIAELRQQLTPTVLQQADPSAGRALFAKSCANCHTLFGEGKKIAPDLTGGQRTNLNYLLENIVDPSLTVSENFRMSIVILEDGRVINGVVVERSEKTLTLQTATERVVVQRDEIEEMRDSKLSMMPENLLNVLSSEQIRDLIAYLMSPSQVPLPAGP